MDFLMMVLDVSFSDAEKEAVQPVIYRMVSLAGLSRKDGILALEKEYEREDNLFLRTGMLIIINGLGVDEVAGVLGNMILACRFIGVPLLERLVMAEGLMCIREGCDPRVADLRMMAMLGENYAYRAAVELNERR